MPSVQPAITSVSATARGIRFVATAWCGENLVAVEFSDVMETFDLETDNRRNLVNTHELRIVARPAHYRKRMPEADLRALLDSWIEHDYPRLRNTLASADTVINHSYPTNEIRAIPLAAMRASAQMQVSGQIVEKFKPPRVEDVRTLVGARETLGFKSTRQMQGHLEQLVAVGAYLEAVREGAAAPHGAVSEALSCNTARARNLIHFARESGYLKAAQRGSAGGFATEAAQDLSDAARRRATEIRRKS